MTAKSAILITANALIDAYAEDAEQKAIEVIDGLIAKHDVKAVAIWIYIATSIREIQSSNTEKSTFVH